GGGGGAGAWVDGGGSKPCSESSRPWRAPSQIATPTTATATSSPAMPLSLAMRPEGSGRGWRGTTVRSGRGWRWRHGASGRPRARAADARCGGGCDVGPAPARDPVGEHEQQHPEHVEDRVETVDERGAAEDREAAQCERGDDPPEQQPPAQPLRHAEVREQQDE